MSDHAQQETDDELEWEEWDGTGSFLTHCVAGSLAGIAEHTLMYPFDNVKTHMQCNQCPGRPACPTSVSRSTTLRDTFRSIVAYAPEGSMPGPDGGPRVLRLWRGVHTMFLGCVPAHALYFSSFEVSKRFLGADQPGHHPLAAGACGSLSTFFHDSIMAPMDTIKQRLQLGYYSSIRTGVSSMVRREGLASLYRSFPTTLAMNVPYGFVMVAANESLKKYVNPTNEFSIPASMFAGSLAGGLAAGVTTPLDVVKTRLQTQELVVSRVAGSGSSTAPPAAPSGQGGVSGTVASTRGLQTTAGYHTSFPALHTSSSQAAPSCAADTVVPRYSSSFSALRTILKEEGAKGLFRGVTPRLITHAPAVAISWTAYEGVKGVLVGWGW